MASDEWRDESQAKRDSSLRRPAKEEERFLASLEMTGGRVCPSAHYSEPPPKRRRTMPVEAQ